MTNVFILLLHKKGHQLGYIKVVFLRKQSKTLYFPYQQGRKQTRQERLVFLVFVVNIR